MELDRVRKVRRLLALICAVIATMAWTESLLLSQNTLLRNGRWLSVKRTLEMSVMAADSFLLSRTTVGRNHLNMSSWHGCNMVVFKDSVRPKEIRFRLKLSDDAELSILFDGSPTDFSGLRLSRDLRRPSMFFKSASDGRFIDKSPVAAVIADDRWRLVALRFQDGQLTASLDGIDFAAQAADSRVARLIGFRAGRKSALIDDVYIEDVGGAVHRDSFRNDKNQRRIFLLHAGFFLLLFVGAVFIKAFDLVFPLLAAALGGVLWLGLDYSYYSSVFEVDVHSRPLGPRRPAPRFIDMVEDERYKIFQRWNVLLTGTPAVSHEDFDRQGYLRDRVSSGPIVCSARAECALRLTPPRRVQKRAFRVLFVGTSQTIGAGALRLEETFFVKAHRRLTRHFKGRLVVEAMNMAVSGAKIDRLLTDYMSDGLGFAPDLVVINLGTNDDPRSLRRIEEFLSINRAKGIRTMLLKEAVLRGGGRHYAEKHHVIEVVGEKYSVPVYDLNAFLDGGNVFDSGFMWWDGYHLTSYGQTVVSDWLSPKLIESIERSLN